MSTEVQAKIQTGEKVHAFLLPWDVKLQHEGRVLEEGQLSPGLDVSTCGQTYTQNKIHPVA